jgi:hypothetical protein
VAETLIRHGILRVTSIDAMAGEAGLFAEVLPIRVAVSAPSAGLREPRHADALTQTEAHSRAARVDDFSHDLVTRRYRAARLRQFAVEQM